MDPGPTLGSIDARAAGCSASAAVAFFEDSSTMSPTTRPAPPTAKPIVEPVAAPFMPSMSDCALVGQLSLPDVHSVSSDDRLPSAMAPKMDPAATPAAPMPIRTKPAVFDPDPVLVSTPAGGGPIGSIVPGGPFC